MVIDMIEIKLLVDDIDYEKTAETLLPALAEHMKENGGALSALSGLFSMPGSFGTVSAKAILSKMPSSSKVSLSQNAFLKTKRNLLLCWKKLHLKTALYLKLKAPR